MSKSSLEQERDALLNTKHFSHLPAYTDPTTGLLARWPSKWIPYGQLMRLDRPGGFYAFYFPYVIGLAYAACITPAPLPVEHLFTIAVEFLAFNVLLRGAACTWNDIVDRDFDRHVERCRHRPIARGAVSPSQGLAFTLAQLVALYGILLTFPDVCKVHTAISTVLLFVYALMKRVTYYPQVVLGFPFAWAIFITLGALEMDPLSRKHLPATLALFAANVLWTITYDTIYAHQDVDDDEKAGVKGMALRFRHSTKLLASCLTAVQLVMLALCGIHAGLGPLYFIGTVGGVAAAMTYFIYDVDLSRPESCGAWFHDQFWLVGAGFVLGFALEYTARQFG
ncbi:Para-hydroxybenzoate--polyprenyltransferase, mitochondrial precursor (PHB:polyprenyltransferase) [Gnomoniopsis smithogilvyi]|uniref:4-hydroxybenzoate polyprenyltransferase, mitochondrial n=1 Tax=Gnomoniopsis smithogilvyi TaxID=1191159 RepID=A0A9W9CTL0_9PEZI|nr:Para-hydroxybenzoate--polyprenyltransferase, mitochondrial precursor (PHB:polyprenyltransferase) [Gnomoniopsis smithogilvyi]